MKTTAILALALAVAAPVAPALADEQADGSIQPVVVAGGYQYNITLQNTGTTGLGSFWFSWVPDIDFLPSQPANLQSPAGWSASVITNPYFPGDGYSIQWVASTPLAAGQSLLGFSFFSEDDPATMGGYSPVYFGYYPTTVSYAYIGAPETDAGALFYPTVLPAIAGVPEPATLSLSFVAGAACLLKRRCRRTPSRR